MQFRRVLALRGPNVWARVPVLEAWVELGELDRPANEFPGLADRLLEWLPSLAGLGEGADLGTVLAQLAVVLQARAGTPVGFGRSAATAEPGLHIVAVAYDYEALGRACLDGARRLCLAALRGESFDVAAEVRHFRDLRGGFRWGAGAAAVLRAARARGIPAEPLGEPPCRLLRLGQGVKQRRVGNASTDQTGAIAQAIAQDKELTRLMLREAGVPVPEGRPVADADDAWEAARQLGLPVVVKPRDSDNGRGVSLNLTTPGQVRAAYAAARRESEGVLAQRQAPGWHHRLVVIGGRLVAAVRRDPAQVVGDGTHTIAQLIDRANADPARADDGPLCPIRLDEGTAGVLAGQGYTLDSVPPAGARVLVRHNSQLSDGGTVADVTARVHPEVLARALEAARVVGLDVAGLDVVAGDLGRPLEEQGGVVVEVNDFPWLGQHVEPLCDPPRPVGEAIVELFFPPGQNGRIPVVAVTGDAGAARLIAHLLGTAGHRVGVACADGLFVAGRRLEAGDCVGARGARAVLRNPTVEAAVLETSWASVLREGLGFDRCDVAVVTGVGECEHPAPEARARVRRVPVEAVAPGGAAVLRADDPPVAELARDCPGSVIFFAREPDQVVLREHRAAGGRAVFVRRDEIILAQGRREDGVIRAGVNYSPEAALAAVAAGWALGLPPEALRAGMESGRQGVPA